MDIAERYESLNEAFIAAFRGFQSTVWTSLPGAVVSYDTVANTVSVQCSLKINFTGADGVLVWKTIPIIQDVPVVFPQGGGYLLTFPLTQGDEVLVVFSSRCIDAWWHSSGVQELPVLRMHDLSDGFAIPGPYSKPKVPTGISTTGVQLRDTAGTTFIEIASEVITVEAVKEIIATAPVVAVNASVSCTITSPQVTVDGNMTVTGLLTAAGGLTVT